MASIAHRLNAIPGIQGNRELTKLLTDILTDLTNLRTQLNTHIHSGVTAGAGNTGAPTTTASALNLTA